MRYIELFSGVGGFRVGIERAFSVRDGQTTVARPDSSKPSVEPTSKSLQPNGAIPSDTGSGEPGQILCVFANEWDKYAAGTYHYNFGDRPDERDIAKIPTSEIPDHDLLVGGFPCQTFSVAGKRAGFDDTRGTMFFEIARILADKNPQHLLLENVKGLLTHDEGRTFQTILGVLADLGYRVEWQLFNSKDFGVPQNRERVYIIGHLGACCGHQVFPITKSNGETSLANGKVSNSSKREFGFKNIVPCLAARDYKEPKIVDGEWGAYEENESSLIRRLTPTECERLQAFPDGWTKYRTDTTSLVLYNSRGNIEVCKKSKIISTQTVRSKIVADQNGQISAIVLCTTSAGKDMAIPIKSYEQIIQADRVSIAINLSENRELMGCVASIIKCDGSTTTLSIWKNIERDQGIAGILDSETANLSIERLSRLLLGENYSQTKLSTISTAIKQTIGWLASTLLTEQTTLVSMLLSPNISDEVVTFQICDLTEQHIERNSDSERYKMCGNALTTTVVTAIISKLFKDTK